MTKKNSLVDRMQQIRKDTFMATENKEKHAVCDEYCKGCMYSQKFSSLTMPVELGCDYMFVTGKQRGCPAGSGCNKKTVGVNRQRPLTILY